MIAVQQKNIAHLKSQYHHWMEATSRLSKLENLASSYAWTGVDRDVKQMILDSAKNSIGLVDEIGREIKIQLQAGAEYDRIRKSVLRLRQQYLKTETTIHFFTDALNSRTNVSLATLLRACDILCKRSMEAILPTLGKQVPHCFTFLDKGLGASILKSGLRLWDGSISRVAAIKITFHNLYRPTAAIHETGHQIAHMLHWNTELASSLRDRLGKQDSLVGNTMASWASEIAADVIAFSFTGYAAVASLYNVVAGTPGNMFAFHDGDPHPIPYLRVLFNIECCKKFYGRGPWDDLESALQQDYPIERYNGSSVQLIKACKKVLSQAVDICLATKYKAFDGRSLAGIVNPELVSPTALDQLEKNSEALQQSHAWVYKECLKMLALTGYRIATIEKNIEKEYKRQGEWMMNLGIQNQLN